MNLHLNPGDPCWVRNWKGEIVQAEYEHKAFTLKKEHWVNINGNSFRCSKEKPQLACRRHFDTVRFVLMPNNTEK